MFELFTTKEKEKLKDQEMSDTKFKFKKDLNCKKNLKKALKLVKKYNITKNIPFEKSLYVRYTDRNSWYGELGHRCFIELDENNNLFIYERNVYENTILVNIKLKILKSLENE